MGRSRIRSDVTTGPSHARYRAGNVAPGLLLCDAPERPGVSPLSARRSRFASCESWLIWLESSDDLPRVFSLTPGLSANRKLPSGHLNWRKIPITLIDRVLRVKACL